LRIPGKAGLPKFCCGYDSVGFWTLAMALASVKVFPEPVTPTEFGALGLFLALHEFFYSCGWSL